MGHYVVPWNAGWSSPVARQAHNLKVVGSNPTPATNSSIIEKYTRPFPLLSAFDLQCEAVACAIIISVKPYELISFHNPKALAQTAATAWLEEVEKAGRAGKSYCAALSGGRITQEFFRAVVEMAGHRSTRFDGVHFFWTDERCVPPTDSQSNYRLAREGLFEPLNIPAHQIHRVRGEDSPAAAAQAAAAELCRLAAPADQSSPVMDMIFLGLGEDGHVASLFPGEPESLAASPAVYRAIANSPKPPPNRVTLGYSTIAAARKVWMLVSGAGKEAPLRASLSPDGTTPFARVLQTRSDTRIFTDVLAW